MKGFFVLLIWLAIPLATFFAPWDWPEWTCLLVIFFPLSAIVITLVLLLLLAIKKNPKSYFTWLVFVSSVLILWFTVGFRWGAKAHLFANQNRYQTILTALNEATTNEARAKICGDQCQIISTDPLRVNFHFCHCFLNWTDLVYDPSNQLATMSRNELREKAGIYLYEVEPLQRQWSIGYFGD